LLSWILAAVILAVLALIHAELGTAYPVAGGTARFPAFAFGRMTGFMAGWSGWLQAVALAPIEVEASLQYINNISWVGKIGLVHADNTLTGAGLIAGTILMLLFTLINIIGVKLLAESNSITVIWKTAIPILTVIVLISLRFHPGNFSTGGGFAPNGAKGVFSALPAGVVFALQGFEQAIQLGGEARDPQKDMSRAILTAMFIGAAVYILLEVAFIGSLNPADIAKNWDNPIAKGAFGPYATLATGVGATWLAYLLYADAFVSPAGTGLLYLGTTSRLSYAMGHAGDLPKSLGKISLRGVPIWSIGLALIIGELAFLPFPSWQSLVGLVTSATAIMYGLAPVSLAALRKNDPNRNRPYRLKGAAFLAPAGFCAANLIIYWGGFDTTWKIEAGLGIGLIIFIVTRATTSGNRPDLSLRNSAWVWPWLIGTVVIGWLGRYDSNGGDSVATGAGQRFLLPAWIDLLTVIIFNLVIFYWAVSLGQGHEQIEATIQGDQENLEGDPILEG